MKNLILLCIFLIFSSITFGQDSLMRKLPDTGQNKKSSILIGEDADYNINTQSFIVNSDSTVKDKVTNLIWQRGDGGEMTWEMSANYCSNLKLGGYAWRLPNSHEIYSILNLSKLPAIDYTIFYQTAAEYWWTNETLLNDSSKIWVANAGGGIGAHPKVETISAGGARRFHAKCVRNVSWTSAYKDNFDGTIYDSKTSLTWIKLTNSESKSWQNALSYSENLIFAGFSDWRLPNIKELQSISDAEFLNPSVNSSFFSNVQPSLYWSSTPQYAHDTLHAWTIDYKEGLVSYNLKSELHNVICVRGGIGSSTNNKIIEFDSEKLYLFPNPCIEMFINLYLSNEYKGQILIEVYDLMGQVKFNTNFLNYANGYNIYSINTEKLSSGNYVVRVKTDDLEKHLKLVLIK